MHGERPSCGRRTLGAMSPGTKSVGYGRPQALVQIPAPCSPVCPW